jgi:hypothetical protein
METCAPQDGNWARAGGRAVGVYKTVLELIDLRSFSNLWYWIMLGVMWSSASHWVLGVPWDVVMRAHRSGGQAAEDMLDLSRINTGRLLFIVQTSGVWLVGFLTFLLTGLGVLAFWYWLEFAQAVLLLLAPMAIVLGLSIRQAHKIAELQPDAEALFLRLRRHRFFIQLLGMVSIFVTSMFGMWQNMQIGSPF